MGKSKINLFKPLRAFWFLMQCCLQSFSFYARKVKKTPTVLCSFLLFFFFITIRQTDLEEEATLYSHPKYPPEDTFIISFSKRIVQKLDLILYTIEELVLEFHHSPLPPVPHPPQAESWVESTEHLNMLQEQNETKRLNVICWRVSETEVLWETAMDHLFSCIH